MCGHQGGGQPHSRSTAQLELQPPRHQRPSLTSFNRISTASACILSPFIGSACKQNEKKQKTPNPLPFMTEKRGLKSTPLLLLRSELKASIFTISIQRSTGSPSQSNQARKKNKRYPLERKEQSLFRDHIILC